MPWGFIGYGPDPNLVVERMRELPHLTCLLGNHDVAVIGRMPFETFNGDARRSLLWTENVLTADNMDFLRSIPQSTARPWGCDHCSRKPTRPALGIRA